MNGLIAALATVVGVIGFLLGKKRRDRPDFDHLGPRNEAFFVTIPGTDGFDAGMVLKKKVKGRKFIWRRVGVDPPLGSRFEIRLKDQSQASPLIPDTPSGRDRIEADVKADVPNGNKYKYSLWQVLADGADRELHDPELEIAEI